MTEPTTELTADELIAQLGEKSDDELATLLDEENGREKPRSTVVKAIQAQEQTRSKERAEQEAAEPAYEVEVLIDNSGVTLGCNRHTAYGALSQVDGPITKTAAKKLVKEFLEAEAETDE